MNPIPPVTIFALVAALLGCTGSNTEPRRETAAAAGIPSALEAAHRAYLEGDYTALTERLRDVLVDPSSSSRVKQNAYQLLDKAYEAQSGKLPSTYKLAEPFGGSFQYGHVRGSSPQGPHYRAFFRGPIRDAKRITNITVRRLPDEIVFDKKSGKGTFKIKHDTPGFEDFSMDTGEVDSLPADGVFTTRIELDDGTVSEGWFIAHDLTPSSSPEVSAPAHAESVSGPNPVVRWSPYRSPQYAPFESRILSIYVANTSDDSTAWDLWTYDPGDLAEVAIGNHPGTDAKKLAAGDYWFMLSAGEERVFGPVRLVRSGRAARHFHVVR